MKKKKSIKKRKQKNKYNKIIKHNLHNKAHL